MYYLDAKGGPITSLYPQPFTTKSNTPVTEEDFSRPADARMALGIWPLQSDPMPDLSLFDVTGETYEMQPITGDDKPSCMLRRWITHLKSATELSEAEAAALNAVRVAAVSEIDAQAGLERARYITIAPGQELTYISKQQQAAAIQVDPDPSAEKYPLIYAEVGITAGDPQAVAEAILEAAHQWGLVGAAIENVRLSAKQAVAAATDITSINSIIQNLAWPQEAQ